MFTGCDWSYSLKDKDILDRFHDISSKAIHTGSFSYQIIAWYLLFYLYDLDIRAGSSFESLLTEIEGLKNNRKLEVIAEDDKLCIILVFNQHQISVNHDISTSTKG